MSKFHFHMICFVIEGFQGCWFIKSYLFFSPIWSCFRCSRRAQRKRLQTWWSQSKNDGLSVKRCRKVQRQRFPKQATPPRYLSRRWSVNIPNDENRYKMLKTHGDKRENLCLMNNTPKAKDILKIFTKF